MTHYLEEEFYRKLPVDNSITDYLLGSTKGEFWLWDLQKPENKWIQGNFWKLLGYGPESNAGEVNLWRKNLHPDDRIIFNQFRQTDKLSSFPFKRTIRYFHRDGFVICFKAQGIVLKNSEGKPFRMLGYYLPMDTVEMEDYSHIISQNIRSHSANVTGLINLMEDVNEEEKKECLQLLKYSSGQLAENSRNLSQMGIIHQYKSHQREKRNFRAAVENVLQLFSGEIFAHSIKVETNVPDNLYVYVIPAYLNNILITVIGNAFNYSLNQHNAFVKIDAELDKDMVKFIVRDNGLGLDMDNYRDCLIEKDEKFHSKGDARKFGLYLTKIQIESIGGKMEVEIKKGGGIFYKVWIEKGME